MLGVELSHYSCIFFSIYPGIIADCAHVFGRNNYCHGVLWKNSFAMACIGPVCVVEEVVVWF